ncbi:hypothetical protein [Streptomyces sp. BR123]|uniref:hypothetical protein n=1 Tax=Streptomyces sp. BR123 TaxID=2749828 RepID=UPI00211B28AC|nr:hypothetical protein [Streptomyces sp. BR123]
METWGLVLETTVGAGERKHIEAFVMAQVEGDKKAALAELERRARAYCPEHPRSPKRRRLFRHGDGFLLVVNGAWQSYVTRFTLAELIEDSDRPQPPEAEDRASPDAEEVVPPATPKPAAPRGIPPPARECETTAYR